MKYDEIIRKIGCGEILTEYSHDNVVEHVGNREFLRFDCSGFVAWYIGTNGYLRALAEIKSALRNSEFLKINRFYCQDFDRFYNDKNSLKYWDIHKDISKINPGDILVIVYDDGNGHMMIVDKVLARSESTLDLRIVDSTRLHHKNDTRSGEQTGIGYGDIQISKSNGDAIYNTQTPSRTPTKVDMYIARAVK